tara:strand:+ start:10584 stop:11285 length:702 start_codon:yes stop_codon:yes gene_type:complete
MKKILCTICARGGSKGVKNKNIRELHGKPLIAYTIEQAKAANIFEHIVVSTDSDAIAETAIKYGAEVFFKREPEMASDTAGKLQVINNAFVKSEAHYNQQFDYLVDLDATSPLREATDITNSLDKLLQGDFDNVITAAPSRRSPYFNMVELNNSGMVELSKTLKSNVVRRQDAPETFDMNASIYVWHRSAILNNSAVISSKTGLYIMPEERSIDIDSELDFIIVSFLMKNKKA